MIFLTFLTAIALSAVAAYYSVIGLAEIFPGSFWPVVIMGAVLESSKLVTVSWLYRNWSRAGILLKGYLSVAVTILMLITSMGIFGYLSKAHLEHSSDTSPLQSKVELLQEKIRVERETIEESRKELKQLDAIVDQTVGRSTDEKGLMQAQALRRTQQKDRSRLVSQIEQSQKSIAGNQEVLAPLSVELKKAEADLGPIKYVAALAYGEEAGVGTVEKAVRLVIGLIIIVFDPLAILLLIAGNISLSNREQDAQLKGPKLWDEFMKKQPREFVDKEEDKQVDIREQFESIMGPHNITAQEIESVLPEAITTDEQAQSYITQEDLNKLMIKSIQEMHDENHNVDKHAYLKQPFVHFANTQPMVAPKEEVEMQPEKTTKTTKIEVEQDNVFILDHITGESMPPIINEKSANKYDYDEPFSFKKKPMDGGKF